MLQNQAIGFPEIFAWSSAVSRPKKNRKIAHEITLRE
jgi:hypothetical protein